MNFRPQVVETYFKTQNDVQLHLKNKTFINVFMSSTCLYLLFTSSQTEDEQLLLVHFLIKFFSLEFITELSREYIFIFCCVQLKFPFFKD